MVWCDRMECYTIRLLDQQSDRCCPKCSTKLAGESGLGLFSADDQPMCRNCGKKAAPSMAALLDLAHAAQRVGKCCRHLLTPSMESLLDLARAAENYSQATPKLKVG